MMTGDYINNINKFIKAKGFEAELSTIFNSFTPRGPFRFIINYFHCQSRLQGAPETNQFV